MTVMFLEGVGGFSTDYDGFLLFRDNVQHHLQAGCPSPGYHLIHAAADVPLGGAVVRLAATRRTAKPPLPL